MNRKIKDWIKIGGTLILALSFSIILGTVFFGGNNPQLNMEKGASISQLLRGWVNNLARRNKESPKKESYGELGRIAFSQVSSGVSAREKDNTTETRYEVNKIIWVEHKYTSKSGKTVVLKVPQGKTPPPQSFVDMME